jgi:hypothetical protein
MEIDNSPTNPHSPGPWRWTHQPATRLRSVLGRPIIDIATASSGTPTMIARSADAALIAQAPALLAAAEKSLGWLIGERDCLYDGASDNEGNVKHPEDQEALDAIDHDIDELRALIAACKGEQ